MEIAIVLGVAAIYLAVAGWIVAICGMAGRADRELRIAEGRPDPELEMLGGFAVAATPLNQISVWVRGG
jgi:hypothetical protein